ISHNEEIIGIQIAISDGKQYYLYTHAINMKYYKFSPGSLLIYYMILEGCQNGIEVMDFLPGNENYKKRWGTTGQFNCDYEFFNKSFKSWLYKQFLYNSHVQFILQKLNAIYKGLP